jgi:hypothetical protein
MRPCWIRSDRSERCWAGEAQELRAGMAVFSEVEAAGCGGDQGWRDDRHGIADALAA